MNPKHITVIVMVSVVLLTLLFPGKGEARAWQFGDLRYFTVEQVCRDGARVIAGYDKENGGEGEPQKGDTSNLPLSARHIQGELPTDPPTDESGMDVYGPLITPSTNVLMTYHEEPLTADINDDGSLIIDFNIYGSQTLLWEPLEVGEEVIIYSFPSGSLVEFNLPVEDCFLVEPNEMIYLPLIIE
ncbi:MAG: hypothetical protein AAGF95_10620 [Chloroflexota bacterium]